MEIAEQSGEILTELQISPFREKWNIFRKNRGAVFSLWFLIFLFVFSIAAKLLTLYSQPFDPATVRLSEKFLPPMTTFTSDLVQPVSLTIGFVAVGISVFVGILLGGLAGFYGRISLGLITVDTLIMRFVDIMLCFPTFFLILTVVALLPPSIYNIMIVIGLTSWMGTARLVRAEFLSLREQDYVMAARSQAIPEMRIIFQHIVPNAIAPVLVSATIGVATAILTESALSFLGFGVQPPDATWGNILSDGKGYIFDAPWLTFTPGFTILFVVLAFNLCGEGLREAYNPKLRQQR
jgi:peptide/nickel transport system permease protein